MIGIENTCRWGGETGGDKMRAPVHDATGVSNDSLDSLVVLRGWGMREDWEKRVAV